jgi:hypothetical protein
MAVSSSDEYNEEESEYEPSESEEESEYHPEEDDAESNYDEEEDDDDEDEEEAEESGCEDDDDYDDDDDHNVDDSDEGDENSDEEDNEHGIDCPCCDPRRPRGEPSGYRWPPNVPRKGWSYDGDFIDHGDMDANCQMCTHPIRYQHIVTHEDENVDLTLGVGCVCAERMIEEYALTNRTGLPISNRNPYTILLNRQKWIRGMFHFKFEVASRTNLYKKILNCLKIDIEAMPLVSVFSNGEIFIPHYEHVLHEHRNDPVLKVIQKKIKASYEQAESLPTNDLLLEHLMNEPITID